MVLLIIFIMMDKNSKGPKILKYFLMVLRVIVFPFCHHHRITIRSSRGGLDRWSMFQIQVDTFWRSVVRIPLGARYWPLLFYIYSNVRKPVKWEGKTPMGTTIIPNTLNLTLNTYSGHVDILKTNPGIPNWPKLLNNPKWVPALW